MGIRVAVAGASGTLQAVEKKVIGDAPLSHQA